MALENISKVSGTFDFRAPVVFGNTLSGRVFYSGHRFDLKFIRHPQLLRARS
jgi:hypothetical protein